MNRLLMLGIVSTFVYVGVSLSLLPIWTLVMMFLGTGIFGLVEFTRLFHGAFDSGPANGTTGITFEKTVTAWTQYLYQCEQPMPQSWNCKYCGGPNIEQIKCQYCGMVKE